MKQSKIISAYKAVENIRKDISEKRDVPSDISYKFYKVYKLLQPQYEFQAEEEKKIFEKYNPEFGENGNVKFKDAKTASDFMKDMNALGDLEIELDFKPIDFKIDNNSFLTTDDMIALEDFLNYIE